MNLSLRSKFHKLTQDIEIETLLKLRCDTIMNSLDSIMQNYIVAWLVHSVAHSNFFVACEMTMQR